MSNRSLAHCAVLVITGLSLTSHATAQPNRRAWIGLTGGLAVLTPGGIAEDFNTGVSVGLVASLPMPGRLSIRAGVERTRLPLDRSRFFRLIGLSQVDLTTQMGAAALLTSWSLGPEVRLWGGPRTEVFSFGTLGLDSRRDGTEQLVDLYCRPSNAPARSGCNDAIVGTRVAGRGASLAVGGGLRWRDGRGTAISVEGGYARSMLSPHAGSFPLRVGLGVQF